MKKTVLIGLVTFLLASSLAFVSCGDDGGSSNPFVGTWVTVSSVPATVKFTGSDWTLTVPSLGITEKGNYSFPTSSGYLVYLQQNGANVGQAVITVTTGIMTFSPNIPGPLYTTLFQFRKE
jgi:hypothetical protein